MKRPLSCNPYFKIWFRPRQTIREIIEYDLNHHLVFYCLIAGFSSVLSPSEYILNIDKPKVFLYLSFSILFFPVFSFLMLNFFTYLSLLSGHFLGGNASFKETRAATYQPWLCGALILGIQLSALDNLGYLIFDTLIHRVIMAKSSILKYTILGLSLGWCFFLLFIHSKTLGEVQGFSSWRGLGNVLMAILMFLIIMGTLLSIS